LLCATWFFFIDQLITLFNVCLAFADEDKYFY